MSKPRRPPETPVNGLLVIDKPQGLTSHDVVARVRRIVRTSRVGHTGTLDPMATGVLVLCLGKATRLIPFIEEGGGGDAKEYEARIRFGFETTTDDAEGEPRSAASTVAWPDGEAVKTALAAFLGDIQQIPPAFSAKKIGGERAYAVARRGDEVELEPSLVHVAKADLLESDGEFAVVRFSCSRGTYIRALARDIGRALGVGGHLVALRRTRSGRATLDKAHSLEQLEVLAPGDALTPMLSILDWPRMSAGAREADDIRQGRAITCRGWAETGARILVDDGAGTLLALARAEGSRIKPFCVF